MVSIFNIQKELSKTGFNTIFSKQKANAENFENISNPLLKNFKTKTEIEAAAITNPCIRNIMENFDLPLKANFQELEKLIQGHLKDTRTIVIKIYLSLPQDLKKNINLEDLQEAATLHDYGKVLIPEEILNKKGKLTEKEFEIMKLHPIIGYELLKNKGYNENVLNLIKYHHQTPLKNGYPNLSKEFQYGIDSEILNVADKYTALREKRCYKNQLGKYEALEIIAKEVNKGEIRQEIYTALIKSV